MSTNSRPAVLAMLLTAALVTSGIAGVAFAGPSTTDAQTTETPDGEDVIDAFVERLSTLETVEFTRTTESTFGNETTTRTIHVIADLEDGQKRTETVNNSVGVNTTTVMNESTVVTYNEDENTVSEYEISGDRTPLPSISPLGNESLVSYEFAGTATVEGEDAYVLEGTPQLSRDTEAETTLTVYVDTETYFPVKLESATSGENYDFSSTVTHTNVTLNEPIPDGTFELDVPDDASEPTVHTGPDVSSFDSYDALAENATLSVPDADLPAEFTFERGTIIDGDNYYSVSLSYSDGNDTLGLSVRDASDSGFNYSDSDRYETVDIGETTGYLYESESFTALYWNDDSRYSLYGQVSNETAIDVAESVLDG